MVRPFLTQSEGTQSTERSPPSTRQAQISRSCRKCDEVLRRIQDVRGNGGLACGSLGPNRGVEVEAVGAEIGLGDAAIGEVGEPEAQNQVDAVGQGEGPAEAEADGGVERGAQGESGGLEDGVVGRVGPAEAQSDLGMKSSPPGPFEALKPSRLVPQGRTSRGGPSKLEAFDGALPASQVGP